MKKDFVKVLFTDAASRAQCVTFELACSHARKWVEQYGPDSRVDIAYDGDRGVESYRVYCRLEGTRLETDEECAKRTTLGALGDAARHAQPA